MTIHVPLLKHIILAIVCIICTTSCCKKCIIDNINKDNLNKKTKIHIDNKDSFSKKNISQEIHQLKNINTIYFNLDEYNILPNFFQTLNQHARFLCKHHFYRILIEGHTDERGTPEYNIALGERRAHSVQTYLQSLGVTAQQMIFISYGKEKPVSLKHNESDHAKNRRVVIKYQNNNEN